MNTDIITLTEIKGTDSVSSSRITINDNFKKLVKAVGDLQTRIDTSKNTIYINVIETESGEFAIKTTPNHTTRFKINNAGQIFIGAISLDEYIRRVVNNTKLVELKITGNTDNDPLNYQMYSGEESKNDGANFVTVYYTSENDSFEVKFKISEDVMSLYPNAMVYIYDPNYEPPESGNGAGIPYQFISLSEFVDTEHSCHRFDFDDTNINAQRTIGIRWVPNTAIQEFYSFSLKNIEEQPTPTKYYTVHVNYDNSLGYVTSNGQTGNSFTVREGGEITLTAVPINGSSFVSWENGETQNPRTIDDINEDLSLSALFEAPHIEEVTITVDANPAGGGVVSGGGTYNIGDSVTITATANNGYTFIAWNDGNTDASRTITVTENKTYTATFEQEEFTISMNYDDSLGSVTGNGIAGHSFTVQSGGSITLKAIPVGDARFVKWWDNIDYPLRDIDNVTADLSLYAIFE